MGVGGFTGVGAGIGAGVGVGVAGVPVPVDGGVVPLLVPVADGVAAEPGVPEVPAGVTLFEAAVSDDAFAPVTPLQPHATARTSSVRKKKIALSLIIRHQGKLMRDNAEFG